MAKGRRGPEEEEAKKRLRKEEEERSKRAQELYFVEDSLSY